MGAKDSWFDHLYLCYSEKLIRTAKVLLNDRERAEEMVHDAYVLLLVYREKLETHPCIAGWLFQTLHYRLENEVRLAANTRVVPLDLEHYNIPGKDAPAKLEAFLPAGLSRKEKELLIWFFEYDMTHEEIAAKLQCSVHACHMRLYRAKRKCYHLLKKNNF